ncbi:MAG: ATP-binding protein [Chloroflexota bacterium]
MPLPYTAGVMERQAAAAVDPDLPFADLLREYRHGAGLTQEELAASAGVSTRTVSDLERGLRRAPQEGSGELLAAALGLCPGERERFFAAIRRQRLHRRPPAIARARIPAGAGPILGRAAELAEVERRLAAGARVVTLAGAGGVGTTTIAREAARRRQEAGGLVIWTPLEAVAEPAEVLAAVARSAGIPERPGVPAAQRIGDAIGRRPALLALDNLEHLLEAAPEIAALLEAAPGLSVIATSRETIRIAGEEVLPVDPLPLPPPAAAGPAALAANPAVALFLRRAGSDAAEAGALDAAVRIVTLMDGLPLAIELAAAQTGTVPLASLPALLETSGIDALALGRRDGPSRFASMEAALAWSESRLPGEAARLLRLLGVFRGGFTPEAVAGVAAAAGMAGLERGLLPLASAQLIRQAEGARGRFRMLEPVRMFAGARLRAAGEEERVRLAHAAWTIDWARRHGASIGGSSPLAALDAVEADLANLRAALAAPQDDLSAALEAITLLRPFWEYRGYQREVVAALESLVGRAEGTAAAASPWFLWGVFWVARFAPAIGEFGMARAWSERFERLAARSETPEVAAFALGLRWRNRSLGEDDRRLRAALAAMRREGADDHAWGIEALLGRTLLARGDHAGAIPCLRDALASVRRSGALINQPEVQGLLGLALLEHGDAAAALPLVDEALEIAAELGLIAPAMPALLARLALAVEAAAAGGGLAHEARAARLLGAAESLLERLDAAGDRWWASRIAAAREQLSRGMDAAALEALADDGRDLSLRDAAALAVAPDAPGGPGARRP